jgi:hypothetical protein
MEKIRDSGEIKQCNHVFPFSIFRSLGALIGAFRKGNFLSSESILLIINRPNRLMSSTPRRDGAR